MDYSSLSKSEQNKVSSNRVDYNRVIMLVCPKHTPSSDLCSLLRIACHVGIYRFNPHPKKTSTCLGMFPANHTASRTSAPWTEEATKMRSPHFQQKAHAQERRPKAANWKKNKQNKTKNSFFNITFNG